MMLTRIYRVTRDFYSNDLRLANIAPPIGPLLQEDFPEIESVVRLLAPGQISLTRDDQTFREELLAIVDPGVLDFFSLTFVEGDPATALANPTDLVVTRRAAERYFGSENPIGKSLKLMGQMDITVTAVIEDLPENTHMEFEMLGSMAAVPLMMGPGEMESWGSNNYYTYIRLPVGYNPDDLESRFDDFLIKHRGEDAPSGTGLNLQKLTEIHLTSDRDSEWKTNGSISSVYTFSAVALFVLIIACINFMNLTTARSTQRAREVGIRKVVGATRGQLIMQFLGESILLTTFSMLLAVAVVELLMPFFAAFVEKPIFFSAGQPVVIATLLVGILGVGLLAGSYPAFYLSRFRPAEVLKGSASSAGSAMLRKVLVVFQFSTSIALLIATGVVIAQMQYARNLDMGYDKSRNMVSSLPVLCELLGDLMSR